MSSNTPRTPANQGASVIDLSHSGSTSDGSRASGSSGRSVQMTGASPSNVNATAIGNDGHPVPNARFILVAKDRVVGTGNAAHKVTVGINARIVQRPGNPANQIHVHYSYNGIPAGVDWSTLNGPPLPIDYASDLIGSVRVQGGMYWVAEFAAVSGNGTGHNPGPHGQTARLNAIIAAWHRAHGAGVAYDPR